MRFSAPLCGLAASLCFSGLQTAPAAAAQRPGPSSTQTALTADKAAAMAITAAALRGKIRFLADDQTGGRQPGSAGDRLVRTYLAAQMEEMGLVPAGDPVDGKPSYFQWVQMIGMRCRLVAPPTLRATATATLPIHVTIGAADMVFFTGEQATSSKIKDAEIVFVGYGITAPEFQWDDYKGTDVRGKVLLLMNNDPESDPKLFGGKTRLYYGRWDYKYLEAARHGAAGAILIHTTPSAGYPWTVVRSSWSDEKFEPPNPAQGQAPTAAQPQAALKLRGWLTEDASRRVAQAGGQDLDALGKAAERRDFHPVPLGVSLSVQLATELRTVQSANVLGLLPGADPKLRQESVVYTAHIDHLGTHPEAKGVDKIFNGALDNASGVAGMLAIAKAAVLGPAPKRSLLFAAVTGEENGLIGSEFLVNHLPKGPLQEEDHTQKQGPKTTRVLANINIDGLNVFGMSPHVVQIGRGKSNIDGVLDAVAAQQKRKVLPDQMPDRGSFYRSDQLNFARVGIPSIYLNAPMDLLGPSGQVLVGAGRTKVERYVREDYHQPSDELRDDWDLDAAAADVRLLYLSGLRLANGNLHPAFHANDEFGHKAAASATSP